MALPRTSSASFSLQVVVVIARNSSFAYRHKAMDMPQVGRELGARYLVEAASGARATVFA